MMGPIADTLIQGSLTQFYSGTARSLNKGLAGRIGKVTKLALNCKVKKSKNVLILKKIFIFSVRGPLVACGLRVYDPRLRLMKMYHDIIAKQ